MYSHRSRKASTRARRALLAVAAPSLVGLAPPEASLEQLLWPLIGGAWLAAVVWLRLESRWWVRVLSTVAVLGALGWAGQPYLDRPFAGLALGLAALGAVARIWPARGQIEAEAHVKRDIGRTGLRSAAGTALMVLVLAGLLEVGDSLIRVTALSVAAWIPTWYAPRRQVALRVPRVLAGVIPPVLSGFELLGASVFDPWLLAVGPLALLTGALVQSAARGEARGALDVLVSSPALALVGGFLVACVLGTALLALPGATTRELPLVDTVFTAVSATCINGLSVLDIPADFTVFGQVLLVVLMQVGGLGIMTSSAAIFALLGRRMSLLHESAATEVIGAQARSDVLETVRRILVVTFAAEGLGILALTPLFLWHGDDLLMATWRALFTAVSAFNNAGLALQSESLLAYGRDPLVLLVVGSLVLVGSTGPAAVVAFPAWLRGRQVPVHVHLVLVTTAALVIVPTLLIAALEWGNVLGELHWAQRATNALFLALMLRSGGFQALDLTHLQGATWTVMLACMFVGGSPGSTGGGVKTTTVAVLWLGILSAVRGGAAMRVRGRQIPHRIVYEAASIASVGALSVWMALLALQITQPLALDVAVFEVVSALGNVGLSLGGTDEVDGVGKLVLTACMFVGRVGPITVFALLSGRRERTRLRYPEAHVPVG